MIFNTRYVKNKHCNPPCFFSFLVKVDLTFMISLKKITGNACRNDDV